MRSGSKKRVRDESSDSSDPEIEEESASDGSEQAFEESRSGSDGESEQDSEEEAAGGDDDEDEDKGDDDDEQNQEQRDVDTGSSIRSAVANSAEEMSLGERDLPPPIRGKGKSIMSDSDFLMYRRQNKPSPLIVIRESADEYSYIPSTFTPSRSAVAPRPSGPAQHPPIPTPCLPPSPSVSPPTLVSPSPPPPIAPTSSHINMIPTLEIMTDAHHKTSTSTSVTEEQQRSPGYSRTPSNVDVHELPEEVVELMADGRPIIRPSGNGFLPSKKAASAISFVIQQRFHRALLSWGKLTSDERISMFDAFRSQAAWRNEHESEIERIFHHKASTRLSDMLRETRKCGSQPPWIGDGTWQELRRYWNSDEFKKKSDQAKKNRASEKGGNLHTGGCVSQSQWAERMSREYNRGVQIHEVHKRTHTRKGNGEYIDERSKRTQEEFNVKMSQTRSQISSSSSPSNSAAPSNLADRQEDERLALNVWADVVGGKHKGRLYGAGDLAGKYRKGPSNRMLELRVGASASSSHRPQESVEIAQLRQMLASSQERERRRAEEHRQMMDMMRQRDEEIRQMMDQMRQMMETVQQQHQSMQQPPQQRQPSQTTQYTQEDDDSLDHIIEGPHNKDS